MNQHTQKKTFVSTLLPREAKDPKTKYATIVGVII